MAEAREISNLFFVFERIWDSSNEWMNEFWKCQENWKFWKWYPWYLIRTCFETRRSNLQNLQNSRNFQESRHTRSRNLSRNWEITGNPKTRFIRTQCVPNHLDPNNFRDLPNLCLMVFSPFFPFIGEIFASVFTRKSLTTLEKFYLRDD